MDGEATTRIEFDRALLAYKLSKNEYKTLKERYQKTRNQLALEYQNAKSQYEISSKDASYTSVNSDMEGLLYETYKKQGEAVRRNDPVAFIGSEKNMYLQLWIDEEDVLKIQTGQEAVISIDMYKGKTFKAKISKIYPVLSAENQSIRVDAVFEDEFPALVSGASAEANIVVHKKEKALAIPKTYLIGQDSVKVKTENGTEFRKIQTGMSTVDFIEVLSGLDTNSIILEK